MVFYGDFVEKMGFHDKWVALMIDCMTMSLTLYLQVVNLLILFVPAEVLDRVALFTPIFSSFVLRDFMV